MTLPDQLTAAEFERLKAQEQRMLNSGSWVPQAEDRLTAQLNEAAADAAAPDTMTAEQADVAEAQQSVMAETAFGQFVGVRPDYSQPPAKDPTEDEPKTIGELRKRQQDLYNDPTYDMPFEEWQDFTRWQRQNESEVGSFISGLPGMAQSLGQLGVGLVKERAQQAYRATAGLDPIGAAATEIATFKEMGRKIGVGLTQLSDWVGSKVGDIVESGRRAGQVQQNVIKALRDNGQLTGDPIQDNTTIQKALEEAAAQGMYEPTQQQAEEDNETSYQRYLRKKSYDRDYSGITEFSIGGNRMTLPEVKKTATNPLTGQVEQPQEATATVGAMAFSPENFIPVGVGVLARARMLRRLASVTGAPLRATETAMASVDDWLARTADRVTSKIPIVGDLPLKQRTYTLAAAGGIGAYLDTTTDSPVVDVIAKPLIVAGAILPAAKFAGGTLRRVGAGAGAGWQVIKEMDAGAVGSARAETAARMAASGKFNPRYSKYMERGAAGGVESTLRRVSQNPEMPETLRRVARSADNIGITQLARGIDDAVSSSVAAGIAATPFALVAPDSETAGNIVGGAVLLGGTLGTAGRVLGRRSARTDADIARMMVDVEMAGGDAGSLGALSYSGLDLLAAMQGITSGKVDFVPLRAQEYRANADVRASGGETVAGLHIEKAADGRAKVYVNMGHTAPIAGRVSIKPVQITRNGKTEDANVVRIKGSDGESDFTVVPREYPLLVKSGDIVEPNARLARGLSPTHVMPHEIGHAILTSSILNGAIRDDLRNLINQRYDTPGVEARGREYVARIVDKDILAGAHDQLPDSLTQQEFDDISSGRRTMADVLKGKPVSDTQREQMITDRYNEMRERSIAEGNNPDGLDVFRDEIVAETFSSLSDSLDFRRMRTGGPQVMESVLAATTRVFETLGMKFDRSTGKPLDNPSVVFRDNPLMKDPIMRKRMQEHLRNYEAWMLGMEQAGAREQKGTQISVDGSAESARRSTHTKLRPNDNGVLENDLIYIDQNGQAQWKPQKMLDEQEKGRGAQVGQLYDKNKILSPNSAEFGLRRAGVGRTVISGPTLPAKFDVLRWFPKHIREMARMLEAGRDGGASHIFDYNTIGTGEGGRYRVINRGDVRAIIREGAFLGWEATKNGHLKAVVMDLNAFRSAAMRAINRGELGIFNNDMGQLHADLMVYLANHKNGLPGEATIGQQKRDMLNGLIGTGTAVQREVNPLYADLNPRGSVRSFRFDRINDITPTGRDGYHFDYDKQKFNRMPSQAMPDAPRQRTVRIKDEFGVRSYFLGDESPSGNHRMRSYEVGDLQYVEQSAGSGSRYVYLADTKTGETATIRISDHFAPGGGGYRVDSFGGAGRSERPDYNIVNGKIYEPTNEPYTNGFKRITPQQFREEMAGWREAFQNASPAIADGAAGTKTTAGKSNMSALQPEEGSALTSENTARQPADVNRQIRGQAMPDAFDKETGYRNRDVLKQRFENFKPQTGVQGITYGWQRPSDGKFVGVAQHHFLWRKDNGDILGDPAGAGYVRIAKEGNTLMYQGEPNAAQLRELKNTAIEQNLELLYDRTDTSIATGGTRGQAMPDVADAPPFYLKSTQALDAKIQGKAATPDQVKAILTNPQNGIKAEELKWTGVMQEVERLAKENNGKVPKEALLKYLAEDGSVRLEESVFRGKQPQRNMALEKELEALGYGTDISEDGTLIAFIDLNDPSDLMSAQEMRQFGIAKEVTDIAQAIEESYIKSAGDALYAKYQLPGGENYREVVLSLPYNKAAAIQKRNEVIEMLRLAGDEHLIQYINPVEKFDDGFRNPHFDTPNYIAHMRLNDRIDMDGKPGSFIEEAQSDRHQQGREKGYRRNYTDSEIDAFTVNPYKWFSRGEGQASEGRGWAVVDGNGQHLKSYSLENYPNSADALNHAKFLAKGGMLEANSIDAVPDAPFRTSWHLQLFKRALHDAVKNGKEWIGWTTGQTQFDRWGSERFDWKKRPSGDWVMSGQEQVGGSAGGVNIEQQARSRGKLLEERGTIVKTYEDVLNLVKRNLREGRADVIAKKVWQQMQEKAEGTTMPRKEGMEAFYDSAGEFGGMVRDVAKYVKQWGGQVEKVKSGRPKQGTGKLTRDETAEARRDARQLIRGDISVEEFNSNWGTRLVDEDIPGNDPYREPRGVQNVVDFVREQRKQEAGGTFMAWRVNITPQMREGIKKAGQALFVGGAAAVVAEDQLDQ